MSLPKNRLQLVIDDNAVKVLKRLETECNASTMSEVVRHAVALLEWARVQNANGYTVGALKDGVPVREVVLPFFREVSP